MAVFKEQKLSESNKKLQRLLAQQRDIEAQIKSIEDKERQRAEKAVALIIRRHKLTRFDPEKLDQALALAVAELEAQQQPQLQSSSSAHGG